MKELSIEEKAQRYDEALERAKNFIENGDEGERTIAESIFAGIMEESEDERIRKEIITFIVTTPKERNNHKKWIAWLEAQGEHKSIEYPLCKTVKDKIDYYIVNHFITDTVVKTDVNSIVKAMEEGVKIGMSEQKPKFRVGDTIKCKYDYRQFTIKSVDLDKGTYIYTQEGCGNDIDYADEDFELVEQNPAWSEEDERNLDWLITVCERIHYKSDPQVSTESALMLRDWLKSLKDRYTWKPSDGQMNALNYVVNLMASSERPTENDLYYNILKSLRQQLMKLKDEK